MRSMIFSWHVLARCFSLIRLLVLKRSILLTSSRVEGPKSFYSRFLIDSYWEVVARFFGTSHDSERITGTPPQSRKVQFADKPHLTPVRLGCRSRAHGCLDRRSDTQKIVQPAAFMGTNRRRPILDK